MDHKKNAKSKTPWPTKLVMEQVYEMKLWGGANTTYHSGEGSHHPELVNPYLDTVSAFLRSFNTPLVVCDLGCGDFNIGKQLVQHTKKYIGLDIVKDLVDYNKATFKAAQVSFKCVDISKDTLPKGDCAVVRQVLQHLSNTEIQNILNKLTQYKYVIITEHIPEGKFVANLDIIASQGTRLKIGSGVDVTRPPFDFSFMHKKELTRTLSPDGKSVILTTLFTMATKSEG